MENINKMMKGYDELIARLDEDPFNSNGFKSIIFGTESLNNLDLERY